nr:LysR family transcriptional regulator [Bradyrhizobium uaiense]
MGRGVVATVAGQKLYARASQILYEVNCATDEIRALAGTLSGRIAVGIPPTLSKAALAPALAYFTSEYPEVGYSDTLLALIKSGELDFAFVAKLLEQSFRNFYIEVMARPRTFDVDTALNGATGVFRELWRQMTERIANGPNASAASLGFRSQDDGRRDYHWA